MKALIVGGAGFVGKYLTSYLAQELGYDVTITKLPHERIESEKSIQSYDLDILNKEDVRCLLGKVKPDAVFHLAAQSSVAVSWKQPELTCNINIIGTLNVLEVIRESEINPKVLLIGSGEEYGRINPEDIPIKESTRLCPGNMYAITKASQNMIGTLYATAYQMNLVMVRAFNHFGPGQSPTFVVSDFCSQVADIEKGLQNPCICVGNLDVKRDFTDVRDVVRAYGMLINKGKAGETYNVGSGNAISIREILNTILSLSKADIKIEVDKERIRLADVPFIEADIEKLKQCTGWKPVYKLEETLSDTLEYWREGQENCKTICFK